MRRTTYALLSVGSLAFLIVSGQSFGQTLTTLHSFTEGAGGAVTPGDLALSSDGTTLYGLTDDYGANNGGTLFSIPVSGGTPKTLYSFADGLLPDGAHGAGVTVGGSALYVTTVAGGASNDGTIISFPLSGGAPTTLYSFTGGLGGANPNSNLTLIGSTLYGTTDYGGAYGYGTIFSIPVTGGTPTVLASFSGGLAGHGPSSTLMLIGSTLYGVTAAGGADVQGEIYSIPLTGGTPTDIASFNGTNGQDPVGGLTLVGSTLYGTAWSGGAYGDGVIFSVPVTGGTPTVLASFNGTDGKNPNGGLTLVGSTLYGMTNLGGANGDGTIFSVPLAGGTIADVASFNGTNGSRPFGSLTVGGSTLYGMTDLGGDGLGTVFALTLPATVPEPSSIVLLCLGALGLGVIEVRRRMA